MSTEGLEARVRALEATVQELTARVRVTEDIDEIQQAGTPFARKVDPEHDAELLQLIDAMVDAQR